VTNDYDNSRSDGVSRWQQPALPILQPQAKVGRFTLIEFLGEGGMGSVWAAEDPIRKDEQNDGRVVLKFLRDDIRRCPEAVEDFRSAYRRTQKLIHQHICPLLDLGDDPAHGVFQVMSCVRGMTLQQWLRQRDPDRNGLPVEHVATLLRPIAKALDYAHGEGLVHRDIKPGNIMVELTDGKVTKIFVVDFGLAAEVRTSMSMHSRAAMGVSGTEPYMAPEQWQGQAQDGRSDQYSLAVVAWQMLTGSLPYQGSGVQLGVAVMHAPQPELPAEITNLQPVFSQSMAKDRKQRFTSCIDLVKALASPDQHSLSKSVVQKSEAPAESANDDLATLLQKTQESVARKHAQAKQLLQEHRYADAVQVLDSIPQHLRDQQLAENARKNRDRAEELESAITTAVTEVRLDGLKDQIAELLELQPERDDMRRVLAQLPQDPPKPKRPALLVAPFDATQAKAAQSAWAKHLGIDVEISNSLGIGFRLIPPGTFEMGSPASEPERHDDETLHNVSITQPKLLGIYPVTQGEWTKLMGSNPSKFQSVKGEDASRFPVEQVRWEDSQTFLTQLNAQHGLKGWRYRLPTEGEWEYACRAGTVTPFWFGGELNGKQANCDGNYPYETTEGPYLERPTVVGTYGANPFGICDQHGNVWEWCGDWYNKGYYEQSEGEDPQGPSSGSSRVLRGGSWDYYATYCRSADRHYSAPSRRRSRIGFRVLCELV